MEIQEEEITYLNSSKLKRVGKLNYDPHSIIGRGSFGVVFTGYYNSSSLALLGFGKQEPVAVKRVQRSHIDDYSIRKEVKLMEKAGGHPNILRYYCTEMTDDFLYENILANFYC